MNNFAKKMKTFGEICPPWLLHLCMEGAALLVVGKKFSRVKRNIFVDEVKKLTNRFRAGSTTWISVGWKKRENLKFQ